MTTKNGYNTDVYMGNYAHKLAQLDEMLNWEQSGDDRAGYGAPLSHWAGTSKSINIDAGALQALIDYYEAKEA